MIPLWLTSLVIVAALFACVGLLITLRTGAKLGRRSTLAPANGKEWPGVRYALFAGMMPWAKESASQHLMTYFTGIIYHLGIAVGVIVLIATLFAIELSNTTKALLLSLSLLGAAAGIGLLLKRIVTLSLRAISTPDDFIANGLVTLFLIAAAGTVWTSQIAPIFLVLAIVLFLYIPLGKVRHCFLFFCSRITFGRFFGRRGVLPHQSIVSKDSHVG